MLLTQQLQTAAAGNATNPAIYNLGKMLSYRDLLQDIARLSYLYQHEVGHEPRMAFYANNHPSVIKTMFAVSNIKGVSIPLDPKAPPEELEAWIRDSGATHLAVTSDLLLNARQFLSDARIYLPIIEIEKKRGGEYDSSFTAQPDKEPKEDDPVVLLRTSGTVQEPMLAQFNHRELIFAATSLKGRYKVTRADRILTQMNWAHPFAFVHGMLFPILSGAVCVMDEGHTDAEGLLKFLIESRASRLIGNPKYFRRLLLLCKEQEARLPGSVKSVISGLGPLSPALRKAFALMNIQVQQVYGQTESTWTLAMEDAAASSEGDEAWYSPLPGFRYKVLDSAGDEIEGSDERVGRLAVMGPSTMDKYTGPEKVKKELEDATRKVKRGTWLYTGDLAKLQGRDDDLKIAILGREIDAHFKEGQIRLADPLDPVLKGLKGVKEGAGFFMENALGKTILAAAVVKMPKVQLSDQEVAGACRAMLGEDLTPKVVFFTDAIPRDASGAVNRFRLRRQFNGTMTG